MEFIITFLEGIISFISPCMLPMLPLYVSYFTASDTHKGRVSARVGCFVLGFTLVFSALGLFAGSLGAFLADFRVWVNIVCGSIVIFFGLSYLEVIPLPFLRGMNKSVKADSMLSAFVFGVIYSVSLTPCVGAFLGSALSMAAASGTALRGVLLLVTYSLGLGVPFFVCALLLDRLGAVFKVIKDNYRVINTVCGVFLIVLGVLMALGGMNALISLFS